VRGLRLTYVVSITLLILLAAATLASPLIFPALRGEPAALPEAGKIQVLATAGEWVLQYNLVNQTTTSSAYTFELDTPRAADMARPAPLHTSSVFVDAGHSYVFIYHLRPEQVTDGRVQFSVHRGGEAAPLEELTLHLTPATVGGPAR